MNLPVILDSAVQLGPQYEFLLPVAPTLTHELLETLIAGKTGIHLVADTLPALASSRAGIIASGTATVEAALMGTPFLMVYRVSPLTYRLGRPWVKVQHFAMVNLIAGERIVPELVQHDFTANNVVGQLNEILSDGAARGKMLAGLAEVRARLSGSVWGESTLNRSKTEKRKLHPVDRASEAILDVLVNAKPVKTL
jgi:lipid-A-disaccharide synthase